MEDDAEVLDWGNEDDEHELQQDTSITNKGADDEDAVSLGGDEDDDMEHYGAYQSNQTQVQQTGSETAKVSAAPPQPPTSSSTPAKERERERDPPSSGGRNGRRSTQRSPSRRSQSFSKPLPSLTHSLPPKPVLSSVPFMQPSNPASLIEATAMGGSAQQHSKKSNGKPSSVSEDALPPEWEAKQPSSGSGVYYYNVRTHESTWIRPTTRGSESGGRSSPVKDRGDRDRKPRTLITSESRTSIRSGNSSPNRMPSPPPYVSPTANSNGNDGLSFDDRHYRPGEASDGHGSSANKPPGETRRHQERFVGEAYDRHRRSSPSPAPPSDIYIPSRPPSRGRADDRVSRDQQVQPPPRIRSPDRVWVAANEPDLARKTSGRRQPPQPQGTSSHDHRRSRSASPPYQSHQSHRHRSPPPHMPRERESRSNVPQVLPSSQTNAAPVTTSGRTKTRFDQPTRAPVMPASESNSGRIEDDVYIPDDIVPRRDRERPRERARERGREPELTSSQVGGEPHQHEAKRRRINDDNHRGTHSFPEQSFAPPERSISGSGSGASPSPAEPSQPLSKRAPLPPQSARFQESRKPSGRGADTRSSTQQPRSTNVVDSGVPSGPRHSQHQPDPREANQPPEARGQRLPPSGPSAGPAGGRRRHDPGFNHAARNAMDVDSAPNPPKPPPIKINDVPIRANSGMYADRVENISGTTSSTDAAPRGPRAMSNKNGPSHGTSPAISPTTSMYTQRGQDYQGGRMRERSPPPHLAGNNGLLPREGPPSRSPQVDLGQGRPGAGRRATSNANSPVDFRNQGPREAEGHEQKSRRDAQRAPPGFSGSNSVPIGNKRNPNIGPNDSSNVPNSRFGPPPGNGEAPAVRHARPSLPSQKSYDAPITSPVDKYRSPPAITQSSRRASFSGRMTPPHQHRPVSPTNTFQTRTASARSQASDTWFAASDMVAQTAPSGRAPHDNLGPRTWTPRQSGPPRPEYDDMDTDMRAITPPPISREPSYDDGDRHRHVPNQYDYGRPRQNDQYGDAHVDSRYSRQNQVDDDHARDHYATRPVPIHRTSYDADSRLDDAANNRYVDTYMPPSPNSNRRPGRYDGDSRRQPGDAPPPPAPSRQAQSWDRETDERSSPLLAHNNHPVHSIQPVHQERAAVIEIGKLNIGGKLEHSSGRGGPVKIRRPGPQHMPNSSDEHPMHSESTSEHWRSGGAGEDRRDDKLQPPRSANLPQRPAAPRSGSSLLDRLSLDKGGTSSGSQSLRDRVQVPSKRDRDDMVGHDSVGDVEMEDSHPGDSASKRKKRMKSKRGRRSAIQ